MARKEKISARQTLLTDLKSRSFAALAAYVTENKKALLELRFARVAQKPATPGLYRQTRRNIARALTFQRQANKKGSNQ